MDVSQTGPIALAERRLHWLDQRQRVLSQNVANADTPGYQARDVAPFAKRLGQALVTTDARHIGTAGAAARPREDRAAGERTPNGNGVSLDEQALRIAQTDQQHALATGLRQKYLALFRTALGRTS